VHDERVRSIRRLLLVLGAATLLIGLISGVADRQLLDTTRFVSHADAVRRDPAVARQLAVRISDRLIEAEPDLVSVKPLLEGALQSAIVSPAFRGIFRTALEPLHQAWTGTAPSTIVLKVADLGAVIIAVTRVILPRISQRVPAGIEVRLARFGSGSASRNAVGAVRFVRLLSWLAPLLALACFGSVIGLSRGRRREAVGSTGVAVTATGLGLALATVVTTFALTRFAPDTLTGALTEAAWRQLAPHLRTTAMVAAGAGYLVVTGVGLALSAPGASAEATLRERLAVLRWRSLVARAPVATSLVAMLVGVLLVLEPGAMLAIVATAAGVLLILHGALTLGATVAGRLRPGLLSAVRLRRVLVPVAALAGLALLAGLVVWNTRATMSPFRAAAQDATACNGSPVLCGRRYDDVAFPATHNSMAAANQPGWFLAEQPDGVIEQLDHGIRAFLIDAWYGQPTQRPGVIANTDGSHAKALAQAEAELGADVVHSALRLRNSAGLRPSGPVAPYLCHALCALGSTRWEPLMAQVKTWLDQHPREVVTFIIQDEVTPATMAQVFEQAGLLPDVYTPTSAGSWPTLGEMIDSGRRVVVMAERHGGGQRYPWLLQAFDVMQETPFNARTVADFSCRANRGPATAHLFLVNHWLNQPLRRVRASRLANSDAVLGPRLTLCEEERGLLPNFVAVDNYDQGDLFGQVRRLNGLDGAGLGREPQRRRRNQGNSEPTTTPTTKTTSSHTHAGIESVQNRNRT